MLIFAVEKGFDFNFWTSEFRIGPVDVGLEFLTPWVSENKMIFSQIGDVEGYSFLFVPFADHKVTDVGDHSTFICCPINVMDWSRNR